MGLSHFSYSLNNLAFNISSKTFYYFEIPLVSFTIVVTKFAIFRKEIEFKMNDPFDPDFDKNHKNGLYEPDPF